MDMGQAMARLALLALLVSPGSAMATDRDQCEHTEVQINTVTFSIYETGCSSFVGLSVLGAAEVIWTYSDNLGNERAVKECAAEMVINGWTYTVGTMLPIRTCSDAEFDRDKAGGF